VKSSAAVALYDSRVLLLPVRKNNSTRCRQEANEISFSVEAVFSFGKKSNSIRSFLFS
jgi:hypothetical protein